MKRIRKCIVVLMILCIVYVAGNELAVTILFGQLFGRTAECGIDPGEDCREVTFLSGENLLHGYLYEQEQAPGIVLVCHGMRSCAMRHMAEIRYFFDRGWNVFSFDGTGACRSEGNGTVGIQQMRFDADCAIDWMNTQPDLEGLPIVIYGHSAGAYAAAMLSGKDDVTAAVCVAAFDSPAELMKHQAEKYVGVIAEAGVPFLNRRLRAIYGSVWNDSAGKSVTTGEKKVLILQGTEDTVVPFDLSLYASTVESENERLVCVLMEGCGHSNICFDAGENTLNIGLMSRIADFMEYTVI